MIWTNLSIKSPNLAFDRIYCFPFKVLPMNPIVSKVEESFELRKTFPYAKMSSTNFTK